MVSFELKMVLFSQKKNKGGRVDMSRPLFTIEQNLLNLQ